jgi:hypothetical protein
MVTRIDSGRVKAFRKMWRWSSRGRRENGWKVGVKVDVGGDIMGRSSDTVTNAFVGLGFLMVKDNYQRDWIERTGRELADYCRCYFVGA